MNKLKKYCNFLAKQPFLFLCVFAVVGLIYDIITDYQNYRTRDIVRTVYILVCCLWYIIITLGSTKNNTDTSI
jgi:hypothetical protein